ncbi:hypothetical protein HRbin09_00890 [bacterium HR09]|uniref:Uncharacterized protein n=1 Tax=Thermoanaerobaculum aquaticum TaxID=1312852 RepID=A0A7C2NG68_9BACT|nr:hypothetical protein HRbin09_00890 [bacterium HR09]
MLTGFNTDIEYGGTTYHVQTEDRGGKNPLIESLIYVGGEILASRRTEYRNLLEAGADENAIRILMERQHRAIVEAIRSGRIDLLTQPAASDEGDTTVVARSPLAASAGKVESSRSLDEVIAQWLEEQRRGVTLKVQVEGADRLLAGQPFAVTVKTLNQDAGHGVPAQVEIRFVSTATKPMVLANGSTDASGVFKAGGTLPPLDKGTGILVVTARAGNSVAEAKFLVSKA